MGLSGLDWLCFGSLAAAATVAGGDHHLGGRQAHGWLTSLCKIYGGGSGDASLCAEQTTEELVHAELRRAGREFGLKVSEILLTPQEGDGPVHLTRTDVEHASDRIRERAARWSEDLRDSHIPPRLAERFVTTFVTAAHEALDERLAKVTIEPVTRRNSYH